MTKVVFFSRIASSADGSVLYLEYYSSGIQQAYLAVLDGARQNARDSQVSGIQYSRMKMEQTPIFLAQAVLIY